MKLSNITIGCGLICTCLIPNKNVHAQELSWYNRIGSVGNDRSAGIEIDNEGNIYQIGHFQNRIDLDPSSKSYMLNASGSSDIYLAKYDPNNTLLWGFQIGGNGFEYSSTVYVNEWGDSYISGIFSGSVDFDPSVAVNSLTSNGSSDMFLAKYDKDGIYQWAINIGSSNALNGEAINDIIADQNHVYITGYFTDTAEFNPLGNSISLSTGSLTNYKPFFAKYDQNGICEWAYSPTGGLFMMGYGLTLDHEDNLIFTGTLQGTSNFDPLGQGNFSAEALTDAYIMKYDKSGTFLDGFTIQSPSSVGGFEVITDAAGNLYTIGYTYGLTDFDPQGDYKLFPLGAIGGYLTKYNQNFELEWARILGGSGSTYIRGLEFDAQGYLLIAGQFENTVDFDGSGFGKTASNGILTSAGSADAFIAKYDIFNNLQSSEQIGGSSFDVIYDLAFDPSQNNYYYTGTIRGTADVDPGTSILTVNSAGSSDIITIKLSNNVLPVELFEFLVEKENNTHKLYWATASEINNDYFLVERAGTDLDFHQIGQTTGAGNSNELLDYSFTDEYPLEGINYYRLKQVDFDGRFDYSEIISIENHVAHLFEAHLKLFPNPSTVGQVNLTAQLTETEEEVLIVVQDVLGKELYSKVLMSNDNGSLNFALDPNGKLGPGIYVITASSKRKMKSQRLIIE
ncbi:MAG: T9SS type A sorting domain-containing protein [Flavobacteriales bacterium]|nr:T9SS type A sorting domain-containing protein [Flavobacteriales bacterium]